MAGAAVADRYFEYIDRQHLQRAIESLEAKLEELGRIEELADWLESLERDYKERPKDDDDGDNARGR